MNHLISIKQLNSDIIRQIFAKADHYQSHNIAHSQQTSLHTGIACANLFFEPSTRTCNSFELAQKRHSMLTLSPNLAHSALKKSESLTDMVKNMQAMGCQLFVVRHNEHAALEACSDALGSHAALINAGSGCSNHPTQALIDLYTLQRCDMDIANINVAIIGNIKHSRVAHSLVEGLHLMGNRHIRTIAPKAWQSDTLMTQHVDNLQEGLSNIDVIVCLRVQKERIHNDDVRIEDYVREFSLTPKQLAYANNDAVVLHPGPINRGIELTSEVADSPQSLILNQVRHSVAIRMATIDYALST